MSLLFVESFGIDSLANMVLGGRWDSSTAAGGNSLAISTSTGPFSDGALTVTVAANQSHCRLVKGPGVNYTQLFVGFYLKLTVNTSSVNTQYLGLWDGGTQQISLMNNGSGEFLVKAGNPSNGTLLATSTAIAPVGTWIYVELYVKCAAGAGEIQLQVNGADIIPLTTGLNTAPSGTAQMNQIHLGHDLVANGFTAGATYVLADFKYNDNAGAVNNTLLGPKRVTVFRPTGAGTTTNFTPLAGSNWSEVNANPSTGDASYNSSSTVGNKDEFAHAAASSMTGISGVQVSAICRIDNAGPNTGQVLVYDGTTEVDLPTSAPGINTSYSWIEGIQETKPTGGGSFANADISTLQFGYKLTS